MPTFVLFHLVILLFVGFIGGVVLKAIKQPPVVGYLLAGIIFNLFYGNLTNSTAIEFLAELGVILLLFTLGLEYSLSAIRKVKGIAILGGIVQIIVTIVLSSVLLNKFGFSLFESVFISSAFSLSSTAIVVKILSDKGELDSLAGAVLVGWLIIQDLAVLPMILLLPTIGKELFSGGLGVDSFFIISKNSLLAVIALLAVIFFSKKLIPTIIGKVAALNNRELLLVATVTVAVAAGLITQTFGLSAALGAFLAGIIISESAQTHAIFSEVRPLRDIFGMLFFTSLGLVVPAGFIISNLGFILTLTFFIMFLKFAIVIPLILALGYHPKTSLIVGVALVEVGEFAFVLAQTGLSAAVIDRQIYSIIISVATASILFFPAFYFATPAFYSTLRQLVKNHMPIYYTRLFTEWQHKDTLTELPFTNHVVLCGYGRVGSYIGRALELSGIEYVVIEYNHHIAQRLRESGIEVVYGDPAEIDILDFAQVDKARAVVVAIPDFQTSQQVIKNSLTLNSDVKIYCRTHHEDELNLLKALGAAAIIQPEFEASLSISDKILRLYGQDQTDIEGKITRLKIEHGVG